MSGQVQLNLLAYLILAVAALFTAGRVALQLIPFFVSRLPRISTPRFWVHRKWMAVFAAGNESVFIYSLYNAKSNDPNVTLLSIFVDNPIIDGQILLLGLAIHLCIAHVSPPKSPTPLRVRYRRRLLCALSLAIIANALALLESVVEYNAGQVGQMHFWCLWFWQNLGCIVFYSIPAHFLWFGRFRFLRSTRLGWMWLIALWLIGLSLQDAILPFEL